MMSTSNTTTTQGRIVDELVGPAWLAQRLGDPRVAIVEVDVSPTAHSEGHIPGAVLWNVYQDLKDSDYRLVDRDAVATLIRRSGIRSDSTVVFYGYAPALGFWLMKLFGHADVRILDLSRTAWREQGYAWSTDAATPTVSDYVLGAEDPTVRAGHGEVLAAIGKRATTILDVRSEAEYSGERFWPSGGQEPGGRAGHVPSAVNVRLDGLYDEDGRFADSATLARIFADAGMSSSEVISYCTIGGRAATAWFVLRYLLGRHGVRVYDGSWAEWGRLPAVPVV
jgi:thiosulfate/3-mercaptopyruvate sulfurtransferase